jgi:GNAT superfamily N-acetyltransferase
MKSSDSSPAESPAKDNIEIVAARSLDQLAAVAALVREFITWTRVRHGADAWAIDMYFDQAELEQELANLARRYAPPQRALLLALADGAPAGCVALDRVDDRICQLRRMFVREPMHGRGIGKRLTAGLIALARERGYRAMRLETSIHLHEAKALYRRFGFRNVAPYIDLPEAVRPLAIFMELTL